MNAASGNSTDTAAKLAGSADRPPLRTRVAAILSLVGRFGLIAIVLGVGWWTLTTLTDVLRDPAQPVAGDAPSSDASVAERIGSPGGIDTLVSLAAGGRWEFSDGSATMSLGTVPTSGIEAYWSAPAKRREPQASLAEPNQAWERSLLDLIRAMELKPRVAGTTKTYDFSSAEMRAEVTTDSIAGVERLIAARGTVRDDAEDLVRTLELGPGQRSTGGVDRLTLIPYPPGAERLATRYDLNDGVGAEFARVPLSLPAFLEHTRRAGSQMIFADLGDLAEPDGTREGFCVYNGRTVRAILWQPAGTESTTILAMALGKTKPVGDTKPPPLQ